MAKKITYYADRTGHTENDWAVSYGDVVTLLLVFFIILLGSAKISNITLTKIGGGSTVMDEIEEELRGIIKSNRVENNVIIDKKLEGLDLNIQDKLLFASGEAEISQEKISVLEALIKAEKLEENKKIIRFEIEGHTDDNPIKSDKFPSNWHLSSARAIEILKIFLKLNFKPDKFIVQGRADTDSLFPNRDERGMPIPQNQAKNRRVVIKVR